MATFNIMGCCVLRDTFGFKEACVHDVVHFLQFSTPVTWFIYNDKPQKPLTDEALEKIVGANSNLTNFKKKCFLNDYNKTVLDYYEKKSDYLLVDFASMARDGLVKQTLEDGSIHYFTASGPIKSYLDKLPGVKEIIYISELINDEIITKTISSFCDWIIKKGYKEEQIILVEVKNALLYTDNFSVRDLENRDFLIEENKLIDKLNSVFRSNIKGCHAISLPENIYAPVDHKWSFSALHYADEVYDYIFDSIDLIVKYGHDIYEKNTILKAKYTKRLQRSLDILRNFQIKYQDMELKVWREKKICLEYKSIIDNLTKSLVPQGERLGMARNCPILSGSVHVARKGWLPVGYEKEELGDSSSNNRIEAVRFTSLANEKSIEYSVKVDNKWLKYVADGEMSGTIGKAKPIRGISVRFVGGTQLYHIHYAIYDNKNAWKEGMDGEKISIEAPSIITSIKLWVEY